VGERVKNRKNHGYQCTVTVHLYRTDMKYWKVLLDSPRVLRSHLVGDELKYLLTLNLLCREVLGS
jgi:hypothetical protein